MKTYYTRRVLSDDQINDVQNLLQKSDELNFWTENFRTDITPHNLKSNLDLNNRDFCVRIHNYIMSSLDQDIKFYDFVVPKESSFSIITKTEKDGYFNAHFDSWDLGDYSTTVFLNDPNEYDGGELCLYLNENDEVKIKLDAGWAITYPTGILHRVNEVKKGSRYVSIFWTKSKIKDSFMRCIHSEIGNIENLLLSYRDKFEETGNQFKNPLFLTGNIKNQIMRKYSN